MATLASAPLTIEQFSQLPSDGERHELNAGELITMPPPKSLHSRVVRKLLKLLEAFLDKSQSGEAFAEAGFVLSREPLTVRQPDISVLGKERIQSTRDDDYFEGAPNLAVEIVSPSDSAQDLQLKVDQYIWAGSKQVWVLYPKSRRVHVFYAGGATTMLDETQTLTGGELLPEFSVKVAELFFSESHANA
jgi:Uma2 family endonuclease